MTEWHINAATYINAYSLLGAFNCQEIYKRVELFTFIWNAFANITNDFKPV